MIKAMSEEVSREDQEALARAIEADSAVTATTYGPGAYFYWFLAHHVSASDIRFAELQRDSTNTDYSARAGKLFIVTDSSVILLDYAGAAEQEDGDPRQDFGRADLEIYPLNSVRSVTWKSRNLAIVSSNGPASASVDANAIVVVGEGWSFAMPPERMRIGGDAYFAKLRAALHI